MNFSPVVRRAKQCKSLRTTGCSPHGVLPICVQPEMNGNISKNLSPAEHSWAETKDQCEDRCVQAASCKKHVAEN